MNGAGEYRSLAAEQAAFLRFVGAIAAEEQRIYWRDRGGTADGVPALHAPFLPPVAGSGEARTEAHRTRGRP